MDDDEDFAYVRKTKSIAPLLIVMVVLPVVVVWLITILVHYLG